MMLFILFACVYAEVILQFGVPARVSFKQSDTLTIPVHPQNKQRVLFMKTCCSAYKYKVGGSEFDTAIQETIPVNGNGSVSWTIEPYGDTANQATSDYIVVVTLLATNSDYRPKTNYTSLQIAYKAIPKREAKNGDTVGKTILVMFDMPPQDKNSTVQRKVSNSSNYWYIETWTDANGKQPTNICDFLTNIGSMHKGEQIQVQSDQKKNRISTYPQYEKGGFVTAFIDVNDPTKGKRNLTIMYADEVTIPQFYKTIIVQGTSHVMMLLCLLIIFIIF